MVPRHRLLTSKEISVRSNIVGPIRLAVLACLAAAGFLATSAHASSSTPIPASDPQRFATALGLHPFVGAMHEHSGYSDGWVGSTPKDYYASGKSFGLDFMGGSDHSDFFAPPLSTSQYCASLDPAAILATKPADLPTCVLADPNDPVNSLDKWSATKRQAAEATTGSYTGISGFEWSGDTFGHINVYFSKNYANGKTDGGTEATTALFYKWLATRPELGGGSDGLATFNHPGAKDDVLYPRAGNYNWNDFRYDPSIDDNMVGIETYNDISEYGTGPGHNAPPEGYFVHALDKGWHLAPYGAEDLGHRRTDDWGGPSWAKTVILAPENTPAGLREAMRARHVYSVRNGAIRLGFTVGDELMGSRISRAVGSALPIHASATWAGHGPLTLEVISSHGQVVATGADSVDVSLPVSAGEHYYFVRARQGSVFLGYSAPVWVSQSAPARTGEWLAGDLHVHTCNSHDVYCPGTKSSSPIGDYNTDITEAYTVGSTVDQRFQEAAIKGLDYLAITDHHSDGAPQESGAAPQNEPGFGGYGVIGVPAYENSIQGHAQMLGATHVYPAGDQSASAITAMANALRADGGVFQANHPMSENLGPLKDCAHLPVMHWSYGLNVKVDTVEVWNVGHYLQPPLPAGTNNEDAVGYWECMLSAGWHVGATGGSDSHWKTTTAVQGIGNPTTWVFAQNRSAQGVLDAIKAGRTTVSMTTPVGLESILFLEADRDGDGIFESMVGDTVPAGTTMRVRATGLPGVGWVDVRAGGTTIVKQALLKPGGAVIFKAPAGAKWAHATLSLPDAAAARQKCDRPLGNKTTFCRNPLATLGQTSAIYITG